jgi:cellulose synthase/poly-beta-1,6-N-acetylglucosamine synthase-like glycosyltransferase
VLHRCLSAIEATGDVPYEVVVVDNTRGDTGTELVSRKHGALCIRAQWTGLSGARNAGMRASRGAIVAFLDDDAAPTPGWLSELLAPFEDPLVMAVTGRVLPFEAEAEARRRAGIEVEQDLGLSPRLVDQDTPEWFEICNFGGLGIGTNMALRRASLAVWPGFRESLGRGTPTQGGEEHNAFFDLVKRGYRVAYTPTAVVRHRYPHTARSIRRSQFRYLAGAAAYATLLIVEEPQHSRRTLRYLLEAALGRPRPWRTRNPAATRGVLPRWTLLAASLCGPPLYLLSLVWWRLSQLGGKINRLLPPARDETRHPGQDDRLGVQTLARER